MTRDRLAVGHAVEEIVGRFYESLGFRIYERNWRPSGGRLKNLCEIDLILVQDRVLVFVEVRSFSSRGGARADESMIFPLRKQITFLRAMRFWMQHHHSDLVSQDLEVRCELALVDRERSQIRRIPLTSSY